MSTATEIARIKRILRSGASSVTVDGVSTAIDREELRRSLRELQALEADEDGVETAKPVIQSVWLGGW